MTWSKRNLSDPRLIRFHVFRAEIKVPPRARRKKKVEKIIRKFLSFFLCWNATNSEWWTKWKFLCLSPPWGEARKGQENNCPFSPFLITQTIFMLSWFCSPHFARPRRREANFHFPCLRSTFLRYFYYVLRPEETHCCVKTEPTNISQQKVRIIFIKIND